MHVLDGIDAWVAWHDRCFLRNIMWFGLAIDLKETLPKSCETSKNSIVTLYDRNIPIEDVQNPVIGLKKTTNDLDKKKYEPLYNNMPTEDLLDPENTIRNLSVGLQTMSFPQRVVFIGKILKEDARYYTI